MYRNFKVVKEKKATVYALQMQSVTHFVFSAVRDFHRHLSFSFVVHILSKSFFPNQFIVQKEATLPTEAGGNTLP